MSAGEMPASSQISRVPWTVPRAGSSLVEGSLWTTTPCSSPPRMMSVLVPPTSTPKLIIGGSYTRTDRKFDIDLLARWIRHGRDVMPAAVAALESVSTSCAATARPTAARCAGRLPTRRSRSSWSPGATGWGRLIGDTDRRARRPAGRRGAARRDRPGGAGRLRCRRRRPGVPARCSSPTAGCRRRSSRRYATTRAARDRVAPRRSVAHARGPPDETGAAPRPARCRIGSSVTVAPRLRPRTASILDGAGPAHNRLHPDVPSRSPRSIPATRSSSTAATAWTARCCAPRAALTSLTHRAGAPTTRSPVRSRCAAPSPVTSWWSSVLAVDRGPVGGHRGHPRLRPARRPLHRRRSWCAGGSRTGWRARPSCRASRSRGRPFLGCVARRPFARAARAGHRTGGRARASRRRRAARPTRTAPSPRARSRREGLRTIPPRENGGNLDIRAADRRQPRAPARPRRRRAALAGRPALRAGRRRVLRHRDRGGGDRARCGSACARRRSCATGRACPPTSGPRSRAPQPRRWFATTGHPGRRDGRRRRARWTPRWPRNALEELVDWIVAEHGLTRRAGLRPRERRRGPADLARPSTSPTCWSRPTLPLDVFERRRASARRARAAPAAPSMRCRRDRGCGSRGSATVVSTAASSAAPASRSPRKSSIIAADQISAIGLAMPCPAMSGADPWIAWNRLGCRRVGSRFALGAMPRLPAMAAPRSVRMSPNRLLATTTSSDAGSRTTRATSASTRHASVVISGTPRRPRRRPRPTAACAWRRALDFVALVTWLRPWSRAYSNAWRTMRSMPARGEDGRLDRELARVAAVDAPARAGVLALGVLADEHDVDVLPGDAGAAGCDPGEQPGRTQVDVLVEGLAQGEDESPHGDRVGDARVADRARRGSRRSRESRSGPSAGMTLPCAR